MIPKTHPENARRLQKDHPGRLIVLAGHQAMQLTNDMAAPFLQEASFWWLTGLSEPGWKVIVDGLRHHITLVRPNLSKRQQVFDGEAQDDDVVKASGADEIIEDKDFESYLRQLARKHTIAYTVYDKTLHDFVLNPAQRELHDQLTRIFVSVQDCQQQVQELRAIKTDYEISQIKRAVALTCAAFKDVRNNLQSYKHEYEIEADFTASFRRKNANHAYEPIVAGGGNAVTLHYIKNSHKLSNNKLVLIDIGACVNGYAADITRTYAINPTPRQKQVHSAVEKAHKRIIKLLGPDLLVAEYIKSVDEIMKDALEEVGLLKSRDDTETYRKYFPHSVSHGLGVDVHDSLGAPRCFMPGMVLTVEPGIYIAEENIGVRIEDDILITKDGHKNLSASLSTSL